MFTKGVIHTSGPHGDTGRVWIPFKGEASGTVAWASGKLSPWPTLGILLRTLLSHSSLPGACVHVPFLYRDHTCFLPEPWEWSGVLRQGSEVLTQGVSSPWFHQSILCCDVCVVQSWRKENCDG